MMTLLLKMLGIRLNGSRPADDMTDLMVQDPGVDLNFFDDCAPIIYPNENVTIYVRKVLGDRCVTDAMPHLVVPTALIYFAILVIGFIGNLCTCAVIVTNKSMQNPTNYYLFNLAVSDLLMLILGLPMELWGVFDVIYPYRFGELVCKSRAFLIEFTSYASILTMTCFSVERWLAICHPLKAKIFSSFNRAVTAIVAVWCIAFLAASPAFFIVVINKLDLLPGMLSGDEDEDALITRDGRTVYGTDFCAMNFKAHFQQRVFILLAFSIFFLLPAFIITCLYCHIMFKIKQTDHYLTTDRQSNKRNKKILKILISVVLMFFICWLPFHIQRLLVIYINDFSPSPSPFMSKVYNHIFYLSGYFYYSNSAWNPILYNILSTRYRNAFKKTIRAPFCVDSGADAAAGNHSSFTRTRHSMSRMSTVKSRNSMAFRHERCRNKCGDSAALIVSTENDRPVTKMSCR